MWTDQQTLTYFLGEFLEADARVFRVFWVIIEVHEVVLTDWRYDLSGKRSVAVLVFLRLRGNVVDFSDVDEFAFVHFELDEAD